MTTTATTPDLSHHTLVPRNTGYNVSEAPEALTAYPVFAVQLTVDASDDAAGNHDTDSYAQYLQNTLLALKGVKDVTINHIIVRAQPKPEPEIEPTAPFKAFEVTLVGMQRVSTKVTVIGRDRIEAEQRGREYVIENDCDLDWSVDDSRSIDDIEIGRTAREVTNTAEFEKNQTPVADDVAIEERDMIEEAIPSWTAVRTLHETLDEIKRARARADRAVSGA